MFDNLLYWLKLNHFNRIKRYGLFSHLRFVFNWNVDRVHINVTRKLDDSLPSNELPAGYMFSFMDKKDSTEKEIWGNLVQKSYAGEFLKRPDFDDHLFNHNMMNIINVIFLINKKTQTHVGAISIGKFRSTPAFGGFARIVILPEKRGRGFGKQIILYAMHCLREDGFKNCGSFISVTRVASLITHFKLGFKPQFEKNAKIPDIQRRMWPARLIAYTRVKKIYQDFLEERSSSFEV